MGKFAAIAVICFASATFAHAEDAIDPTVWSKDQWRSDMFQPYATHRQAPARHVIQRVVIERTVIINQADSPATAAEVAPVRPKLIIVGGRATDGGVSVQRPGHACNGVLTLTWVGDHAVSHCSLNRSRVTRIGG